MVKGRPCFAGSWWRGEGERESETGGSKRADEPVVALDKATSLPGLKDCSMLMWGAEVKVRETPQWESANMEWAILTSICNGSMVLLVWVGRFDNAEAWSE